MKNNCLFLLISSNVDDNPVVFLLSYDLKKWEEYETKHSYCLSEPPLPKMRGKRMQSRIFQCWNISENTQFFSVVDQHFIHVFDLLLRQKICSFSYNSTTTTRPLKVTSLIFLPKDCIVFNLEDKDYNTLYKFNYKTKKLVWVQ